MAWILILSPNSDYGVGLWSHAQTTMALVKRYFTMRPRPVVEYIHSFTVVCSIQSYTTSPCPTEATSTNANIAVKLQCNKIAAYLYSKTQMLLKTLVHLIVFSGSSPALHCFCKSYLNSSSRQGHCLYLHCHGHVDWALGSWSTEQKF